MRPSRPIAILLTSHWLSMLGTGLVTTAGLLWLFVIPQEIQRRTNNPYTGILLFVLLPILFFAGLALIPAGVLLARRRVQTDLSDPLLRRREARRRLVTFLLVTTLVNVVIGAQLTYRSVEYMETEAFCGQSCHVMKPEFTAHQVSAHSGVACVACHVTPGAQGWFHAKVNGTRQLIEVIANSYPRPIPSAVESNRLVESKGTCENCHSTARSNGPKFRVITAYKDDEANTTTHTVLMMNTGGGANGGIHGAHLGPGVSITYFAADAKRQTIPRIEYRNQRSGISRTYATPGATDTSKLAAFPLQCTDCHNRPAHTFELPERAVARAISAGELSPTLPFINKTVVGVLKTQYSSDAEAAKSIRESVVRYYKQTYPDVYRQRSAEITHAAETAVRIYSENVFSDLKVSWGTYPNNLGHTDFPGCFRCHDDAHAASDKQTIGQDCGSCHNLIAVDEPAPEALKVLGLVGK